MGRIGISYQEVANAAERLQGQEKNPTVDSVREILGTGSKSTIARYLKEWKSQLGQPGAGQGIPQDLLALVKGLWEQLQHRADQQIAEHQEETKQEVQIIQEKQDITAKHNQALQAQVHQLEETVFQQHDAHQILSEAMNAEKLTVHTQQERITSLVQQLESQKSENLKLHTLLKNVQHNLEHYQAAMQKLQHEQSLKLDNQKQHFEQQLADVRSQLSLEVHDKNTLLIQIEKLHYVMAELEQLQNQYFIAEQSNQQYAIKLVGLQEQAKMLASNHAELSATLDQKLTLLNSTEQKLAISESQLAGLKIALATADNKISVLRDEKLFIAQEKAHLEGQFKQLKLYDHMK